MTARDAILHRIRTSLAGSPPLTPPPVPEVWPRQNPDRAALADRFVAELNAVSGETIRCRSMDEAQRQLADLMRQSEWANIGAPDTPAARQLTAGLSERPVQWIGADCKPRDIAQLDAGLIEADTLLADTGSCMIACRATHERLMCYLPPACVVLARVGQLVEHLPAAWADIARRSADGQLRGEFVIVTGPSRTADIEKILILGVHGPKRLVVLLVD
jgi:L-lactate dehydrogenase complex protein LldG